jgi:PAS domain S-box-containing protein
MALVSLVDTDRQWFKARYGIGLTETPRDISFCGHVVATNSCLVVRDASDDDRFRDNPLVTESPQIRFYAGAPLETGDGLVIGTLCVLDQKVRELTPEQRELLHLLARQAMDQLELRRVHHATRERELVQAALLESLPGLYFHLARDHTFLDVHGTTRQHLYADPKGFIGKRVQDVLSPEASAAITATIDRAQTSNSVQMCQYLLDIEGRPQHFEARIAMAVDGSIVALVNQVTDIKEQNELLESVCRAQTSFLASADPKLTFNGLLGDLLALTRSGYGFIGEVLRTAEGAPFLKTHAITNIAWDEESRRFYDEHAAKGLEFYNLKTLFGAALLSGQPVIANSPRTDARRGGLPPGHPPLDAFLGLPLHSGGDLIGMIGLANRVEGYDDSLVKFLRPLSMTIARLIELMKSNRAKNHSEQLAKEREIHFRTIVDTAIDAIITIDEAGIVHHANPAVERLFGYTVAELIGKSINLIMPSPTHEHHDRYLSEYKRTGTRRVIGIGRQVDAAKKDGTTFPAELAVSEFIIDGKKYFTGVVRDLSDRKRIELLQSEFISTVSHELRTPLTAIRGSLGLVAGGATGELPNEAMEYIDIAVANSDRLVRLVNDILDIEKMQSGKMDFCLCNTELGALLSSAVAANRAFANAQRVRLVTTPNWPTGEVLVDPDRLAQVLTNLISNAVKFSPVDSDVDLSLERRDHHLRVSVRDHGPGITPEFRERLFLRFAQGDASSTRKKGGTGLGLAICKAIIEQMKGQIEYEPALGGGSVFHFDLPLITSFPHTEVAHEEVATTTTHATGPSGAP